MEKEQRSYSSGTQLSLLEDAESSFTGEGNPAISDLRPETLQMKQLQTAANNSPQVLQLKSLQRAVNNSQFSKSSGADSEGNGDNINIDFSKARNGSLFIAIREGSGEFRKICILKYRFHKPKPGPSSSRGQWVYAYTDEFKQAISEGLVPPFFKECLTEAMNSKFGRDGKIVGKGDRVWGIGDWARDIGSETVIGIFDDKELTHDARSAYQVNQPAYGKAFDFQEKKIKIDKKDPNWALRMEVGDWGNALSDLSQFDGLPANVDGTNLITTQSSLWEVPDGTGSEEEEAIRDKGKETLIHEFISHLSVPERDYSMNKMHQKEDFTTSHHHDEYFNLLGDSQEAP